MPRSMDGTATADPTMPRTCLAVTAAVGLVLLAATGTLDMWFRASGEDFDAMHAGKWLLVLLALDREQTLGAWWSSAVLAAAAGCFLLVARLRWLSQSRRTPALLALAGGALLLGLSLDELASVHERLLIDDTGGVGRAFDGPGPWLLPFLPAGVLAGLFALRLSGRRTLTSTWLAATGALCLSTVGLQEDLEFSLFEAGQRPVWLTLLEEGTELLGSGLLLAAGSMALETARTVRPRLGSGVAVLLGRYGQVLLVVAGAGLVTGTALARAWLGDYAVDEQLGLPQWWAGSTAAAGLSAAAVLQSKRERDRPRQALQFLSAAAGVAAIVLGTDAFTWAQVAAKWGDPALRTLVALALATPAVLLVSAYRVSGALVALAAGAILVGEGAAGAAEVALLWLAALSLLPAPSSSAGRRARLQGGPRR